MTTDLFDDKNKGIPKSNFFKFKNVGDQVSGYLISSMLQQGRGAFDDQMVYALEQKDGSTVKVGVSVKKSGLIDLIKEKASIGLLLGFKFTKEIEANTVGFNPTKCIDVFFATESKSMDDKEASVEKESNPVDENFGKGEAAPEDIPF